MQYSRCGTSEEEMAREENPPPHPSVRGGDE